MSCWGPYIDNLSTFSLLKQIAQIPQNLLLARDKRFPHLTLEWEPTSEHKAGSRGADPEKTVDLHRKIVFSKGGDLQLKN